MFLFQMDPEKPAQELAVYVSNAMKREWDKANAFYGHKMNKIINMSVLMFVFAIAHWILVSG
jgi:hypothetical protein